MKYRVAKAASATAMLCLAICVGFGLWRHNIEAPDSARLVPSAHELPPRDGLSDLNAGSRSLETRGVRRDQEPAPIDGSDSEIGRSSVAGKTPLTAPPSPEAGAESSIQLRHTSPDSFHISKSVLNNCLTDRGGRCDDQVLDLMQRLESEVRDERWATETEERLRALALAANRENVVRHCRCGSTVCAIEVASPGGRYGGYLDNDLSLNGNLELWDGIYGYESDTTGARITVSLKMYKRL